MVEFNIKRHDTRPYLAVQIKSDNGSAVDLTMGSHIYFNLATNDNTFTPVLSGACYVTGSTTGECEYRWAASDTNRSGIYLGEFEVTYQDGTVMTAPSKHSLVVNINEGYDE